MASFSNQEIARLLRSVAAALTLKKENTFQIRAYENAADSIEHSTAGIYDLWKEDALDKVPGIGKGLGEHLTELFKTGKVKHFESLMKSYPKVLFQMLDIPGVGPKTALEISKMGVKDLDDLKAKLESGVLVGKGLSEKLAKSVLAGIGGLDSGEERMLLPFASALAEKILEYLKKGPGVVAADPLGSLRRKVATIGDLDFAAAADEPKKVVDYFAKYPGVKRVIDQGEYKATVILSSGQHVDLLVGKPESYGALLQHFTGGKNHNIHLRTYAEKQGLSLSEDGVKEKNGKVVPTKTEEEFYKLLKMETPPPEIREDSGEIEAALKHQLPKLIEVKDIKGDLHIHTNYPLDHPSHGPGVDSIETMVKRALELGYEYIGISDHPPAMGKHSPTELVKVVAERTKIIQKIQKSIKGIHALNSLEIDILGDGSLSIPDEALKTLDYVVAGIHSGHRGSSEDITARILKALENPYVNIISHPTGRLFNQRSSYEADWKKIFEYASRHKKILEINAFPDRLDLRDDLVRLALEYGVKFVIDSDAHAVSQMDNIPFGVSVARRGWVEAKDVVNTWSWKEFAKWFGLS